MHCRILDIAVLCFGLSMNILFPVLGFGFCLNFFFHKSNGVLFLLLLSIFLHPIMQLFHKKIIRKVPASE